MKHINDLNKKLSDVQEELKKQWYVIFADNGLIKKAVSNLENSKNFQFSECGDIESWYAVNFPFPADATEFLKEYLMDTFCVNYTEPKRGQNGIITQMVDANDESYLYNVSLGVIFHNNKDFITLGGDTENEDYFQAIEDQMEKEGCFPGVYKYDRYGDIELWDEYYKWLAQKVTK